MRYLFNVFYCSLLFLLSPWLLYKILSTGKYRRGLWAKLTGHTFVRQGDAPCAWFHGVSVGEIHLLRQVVAAFRRRHPDWQCVVSTTTDTGFDEAHKHFTDLRVLWWPFDFSWAVKGALRRVRPDLVVLAEGEVWPNFISAAKRAGVRVALINSRMSPRSARRYARLGPLARGLFGRLDLCAAQTEEHAAGYRALGVPPHLVCTTGSVKYDGIQADRHNPKTAALRDLFALRPGALVWVAGSTQAPEEAIVLDIFARIRERFPNLRLFLVPRQKDRFGEVAELLRRSRLPFVRRSELTGPVCERGATVLVDTIGELGALWGLADLAFVGGSLDGKRGGQNMLEPAAYGAAVLFGPHVWNFKEPAARLLEQVAAVQVQDAAALEREAVRLLADAQARTALGRAAQQFTLSQKGATERTIDCLEHVLTAARRRTQAA